MDNLKIDRNGYTLVDQVEEKLLQFFKDEGFRPGSSIPNENELANALGIGRTVLREALSRFKMTGMIQSRTKRGMTLAEPQLIVSLRRSMNPLLLSESTLKSLFEMRMVIEIGMADILFVKITPQGLDELGRIVDDESKLGNEYHSARFQKKLYELANNTMMSDFYDVTTPVIEYVINENRTLFESREKELANKGRLVTDRKLYEYIKAGDLNSYKDAIIRYFDVYSDYLGYTKTNAENLIRQKLGSAL